MTEVPVTLRNRRGYRLAAMFLAPAEGGPFPAVTFAHGLYSHKGSPRNRLVAERLVAEGFAALLFDFTGHGESEGALAESTLEQQVDDLGAALDFLAQHPRVDAGRLGVSGSSTGAAVAIVRAVQDPRIRVLALRSPRVGHVLPYAARCTVPALIIVGAADTGILPEAEALYRLWPAEKRWVTVPGAGHLFEEPAAMEQMARAIVAWFVEKLGAATRA